MLGLETMAKRIDPSLIPANPTLDFEKQFWSQGLSALAGIDEAGRGALAGPVYAAAVVLPNDSKVADALAGVRDSKELSAKQRSFWAEEIRQVAAHWSVGRASSGYIDKYGIMPATRQAAMRALEALAPDVDHLLIDALKLFECAIPQTMLIKGDMRSLSIAAASVLAKVDRDAELQSLDKNFPDYGFAQHKGYGTLAHRKAISKKGPISVHRLSFAPMRYL
jgi:ribonuclease HII